MEAQFAYATQHNPYLMQPGIRADGMGFHYPMSGIDYPGMNDVMCGRGGGTNNHIGNIRFRQLVNEHKLRYLAASKVDKPKVAMEVVQIWRALDPPGRFLTKTDASQGDDSLWHDVGDKKAREKASQCLRERTPDVMPFVKQLQEKEKRKKEEEKLKKAGGKSSKSGKSGSEKISDTKPDPALSSAIPNSPTTTSGTTMVIPDTAQSSSSVKLNERSCRSRDDVAQTIPVAAALMENVFDDDMLSYTTYTKQMQDYMDAAPKGETTENGDDGDESSEKSLNMDETMFNPKDGAADGEWVKSFQSLEIGSTMMNFNEDGTDMPAPDSDGKGKQQKATKTFNTSISMLSELTDLSEGFRDMCLKIE